MAKTASGFSADGTGYLTGKLLVAMPSMGDPRFTKSVIYLCVHTPETAMGLIVNRTIPGIEFAGLLKQLKIETAQPASDLNVLFGGPVQTSRGFVLHSSDYASAEATLPVTSDIALTATMDVLKALAAGAGPRRALFALGYAGWGPGQLDSEIQDNSWLVCDPDSALIFDTAFDTKWNRALARLGIDASLISGQAGHA
jgi:putative transcriptional regulator